MAPQMATYNNRYQRKKSYSKSKSKKAPKKFNYVKKEGNLVKDVAYLKKMVARAKPEVKQYLATATSDLVGQVDGNGGGTSGFMIRTNIGGGVGAYGVRIGEEIKLIGIQLRMQFQQQSACAIPTRYVIDVFRLSDPAATIGDVISRAYNTDTITSLIDYNSTLNQLYKSDYKLIFRRKLYLAQDNLANVNMNKDLLTLIKQNINLKYNGTSTADAVNYQYALVVRADSGNRSTTTANTNLSTIINQTAVNTGAKYAYTWKLYYTDV